MTEMSDLGKSRLRFGPFEVDLSTRELRKAETRVKLSGQPFEILTALLERPGQLVTRDELRKRVWSDDTYVDFSHGLNAAVNKLREALCDSADDPRYIETLPRRGYRFIADIEAISTVPDAVVISPPGRSDKEVAPIPNETSACLVQQCAVTSIQGSAQPTAVPPNPSSQSPAPAWKPSLIDDWESTVPVKRGTLVQLFSIIAGTVLITLGTTIFWWHWTQPPSSSEFEARLKQAAPEIAEQAVRSLKQAEPAIAEQAERALKQAAEHAHTPAAPSADSRHRERSPEAPNPKANVSGSPVTDDPALVRLAASGERLKLPEEGQSLGSPAIFRLDLKRIGAANPLTPIVAGRDSIAGPQPSPDGTRLVFMAGSNKSMDIWVCNADGSSPRRLTTSGKTGTPRWSPDSRWIAFDSDGRFGRSGIYLVPANGGAVRTLVEDSANNSVPSWSRDGKYIYFASNAGFGWEGDQVWKVPADGGQAVQVTRHGGFSGFESMDGQTFYYAKHREEHPEIWQVPANGGAESKVSLLHPSTWASWAVTNSGILLLSEYNGRASELQYYDFATRSIHSLATLEKASFWLAAAANGSSIWYSELTDDQARQVFKAGLD
jgi:DNA-binding winged helix-turn-helix (wHTH) protein